MYRMCFSQNQASSAVLGWPGVRASHTMHVQYKWLALVLQSHSLVAYGSARLFQRGFHLQSDSRYNVHVDSNTRQGKAKALAYTWRRLFFNMDKINEPLQAGSTLRHSASWADTLPLSYRGCPAGQAESWKGYRYVHVHVQCVGQRCLSSEVNEHDVIRVIIVYVTHWAAEDVLKRIWDLNPGPSEY